MQLAEAFLLGIAATAAAVVALYFLKFWRKTRDELFLAFAGAFGVEAALRVTRFFILKAGGPPGERTPLLYAIRLTASLLILMAILRKNIGRKSKRL